MNIKLFKCLLSFFLFLSINSVFGFSCNSPSSDQEKFICSNQSLSSLNTQNNQLDQRVSSVKPDISRDIGQTLYFDLKRCDSDVDCLTNSYNVSIGSLNKVIDENNIPSISDKTVTSQVTKVERTETSKTDNKLNGEGLKNLLILTYLLITIFITPLIFNYIKLTSYKKDKHIRVQQSFKYIKYYFLIVVISVLLFVPISLFSGNYITIISTIVIIVIFDYCWIIKRLGYVLDKENKTLTFPSFLSRKTVSLSDISSYRQDEQSGVETDSKGRVTTYRFFTINLMLKDHSAFLLRFDSSLKSDQFSSVLDEFI